MWGSEPDNINSNWAVNPLEDMTFTDWWMHGPKSLSDPPPANAITQIPAGGILDLEIGTNKAFTTMGRGLWHHTGKSSRFPPDPWPSEWPSNLHSNRREDVAGCALGIAYKSNVSAVTPDDFVIFSVAKDCVARALQAFDIPYLPACPNNQCICSWFWIHNSSGGSDQMYMTAFQCNITNPSNRVIGKPVAPVRCDGNPPCRLYPGWGNTSTVCNKPLSPMYWANKERNNMFNPTNIQCAPIYSKEYGYPHGAQHQIFIDDFKCIQNSGDTLISVSDEKPASISSTGSPLVTPACATKLTVQNDGNVVLSDVSNGRIYWSSNTAGKGTAPYRLTVQTDGNLILSDANSSTLWSTGTSNGGVAPYSLKIRDLVTLVLVDFNGDPIWTAAPKQENLVFQ